MLDGFCKIWGAINRCGWLIILLHLFGWEVAYGIKHQLAVTYIGGAILFGATFAAMVGRIMEIIDDDDYDDD